MRIQTILEIIEPRVKNFQSNREFKTRPFNWHKDKKDPRHLGSGYFSKVRSTNDPHVVKKSSVETTTGNPELDDAYWDYVDLIIKNKLWENPYFPRVYKKTSMRGKEDTGHHSVEMERLESIEKATKDDLLPITRKAFNKKGREKITSDVKEKKISPITAISRVLDNAVNSGNLSLIKDDELAKALKILNLYAKNSSVGVDIHEENIMARRTPVGIQLVISDPFSFKQV